MEQPSIVTGSITVDVNNADINDADENKKDPNALWDFASRNKVAIDNHDLGYQDVQKAIESCNGSQCVTHSTPENKSKLAESIDKKVTAFMETISEEVKAKCNAIHIANERSIRDIKEKMGEYRTNITRRLDDFINCHKAVRDNINEIRNLKLETDALKRRN